MEDSMISWLNEYQGFIGLGGLVAAVLFINFVLLPLLSTLRHTFKKCPSCGSSSKKYLRAYNEPKSTVRKVTGRYGDGSVSEVTEESGVRHTVFRCKSCRGEYEVNGSYRRQYK